MMEKQAKRKWLPWEINWLARNGWAVGRDDLIRYEEKWGEKPVELIVERAEWLGREIIVKENATLIPRIETEKLVELVVEDLTKNNEGQESEKLEETELKVAEIGTGSGAISLGITWQLKQKGIENFKIVAGDISVVALETAQKNRREWGIDEGRIELVESNLLKSWRVGEKYDVIVANLPYIPDFRRKTLASSVVDFEPEIALFGGENGLEIIKELLEEIGKGEWLTEKGRIWLEVDDSHEIKMIEDLMKKYDWNGKVVEDENGVGRFWRIDKEKVWLK